MVSKVGNTTTKSDRLLAEIFRHDIGSPLQVMKVSLDPDDPADILGVENLDERRRDELEEIKRFLDATYQRLNEVGEIRSVEEELEHLATEFDPSIYEGTIADYVERVSGLSSLVNDYVKSTETELEEELAMNSVLSPLETYGEISYNGHSFEPVYGDQGLCMVANTLGLNAMEHGEREDGETKAWAEVSEEEEFYEIEVWDNGSGLDDEKDPEKIFEKGNGDNSGLGLYFAREITELFDGNLEYSPKNAEKEDGFGLRWELRKPDQYLTPESS